MVIVSRTEYYKICLTLPVVVMSTPKVGNDAAEKTCRIVMQQCLKADLSFDTPDDPVSIDGGGVVVFVCFLQGATEATASHVAKSILQVKLTEPFEDNASSGRKSCAELFPSCSMLLIPQATLGGKMKGKNVQYHSLVDKNLGAELFETLIENVKTTLRAQTSDESVVAKKVQSGVYGARQILNMSTNGPFTHVFDFNSGQCREDMLALRVLQPRGLWNGIALFKNSAKNAGYRYGSAMVSAEDKKNLLSDLRGRDLVTLDSWTRKDIFSLLWIALDMKAAAEAGSVHAATLCKGQILTCLYEDIVAETGFSKAMGNLGGVSSSHHTSLLTPNTNLSYFGRSISSTSDVIMVDSKSLTTQDVENLATGCQKPVLNYRCADLAPLIALAECLTLFEHYGYLRRLVVGYVGDVANNPVVNTYARLYPKIGMHFRYCSEQEIPSEVWEEGIRFISKSSFKTDLLHVATYDEAVYRAHVIVTKYSPKAPIKLTIQSVGEAELDWTFLHHDINDGTSCAQNLFLAKQCLVWKFIENVSWITRAAIVASSVSYKPSIAYPGFQGVD